MINSPHAVFDLGQFLPYILNQAAEATSRSFQPAYTDAYGMTRTQWRVIANLGKFGAMTAKNICDVSHLEKTKVSRAITALEEQSLLKRETSAEDRRAEVLQLTTKGKRTFEELGLKAITFDSQLRDQLGEKDAGLLIKALHKLIALNSTP